MDGPASSAGCTAAVSPGSWRFNACIRLSRSMPGGPKPCDLLSAYFVSSVVRNLNYGHLIQPHCAGFFAR